MLNFGSFVRCYQWQWRWWGWRSECTCWTCHRARWKHMSNLAVLMLTYIVEGCDHPFVTETYETTMWESKLQCAYIMFCSLEHIVRYSCSKGWKEFGLICNRNWQLHCHCILLKICFTVLCWEQRCSRREDPLHNKQDSHKKSSQNLQKWNCFACNLRSRVTFCNSCKVSIEQFSCLYLTY